MNGLKARTGHGLQGADTDTDCRTWIRTWMAGHGLQDMDRRTGIAGHGHRHELQDMDTDMDCRTWTRTWVRTRTHWIQYKYDIFRQESVQLNGFIIFRQDSVRCRVHHIQAKFMARKFPQFEVFINGLTDSE